ncbi:transcription-repair coupling factor [Propioniciclava soli]|uniref:Transcription-repair-coupling factor n=1 Tax=Propioniciclava soli TaxID=2775081 RepID=A0ABZ3C8X7_9ACTN
MDLSELIELVASEPTLADLVDVARAGAEPTGDVTCPEPVRPLVAAALARDARRPLLVVTSTYREAEAATDALRSLLGPDDVAYFPAWETLPHERLSPRSDTVGRRLAVLRRFAGTSELPPPRVTVAPVRAVLQPQVAGLGKLRPVRLAVGEDHDVDAVAQALVDAAYVRVDLVERRGEFAVRGGIVDVFPPTEEHPLRVDFFGDTVEEIHPFAVADQRSDDEQRREVVASPCRELLLDDAVRARAGEHAANLAIPQQLRELFERISEGHAVDGMEALAPALVDRMELLVDVVDPATLVLVSDPEKVRTRAAELHETSQEFLAASWSAAAAGGKAPIDLGASAYRQLGDVRSDALAGGLGWWTLSAFADDPDSSRVPGTVNEPFRGDVEAAVDAIAAAAASGQRVVLVADTPGRASRMNDILAEHDLAGKVEVIEAELGRGFTLEALNLWVVTSADLSGQKGVEKAARQMPARRKNTIDPLELTAGDHVVHDAHGVGRYVEMVQRTIGGATREYLVIEYAASKRGQPADRLFVPMDALDQITRYVGGEAPTLDRMGGADWNKRKSRARKAVRQIAAELIKLYAARQASEGYAFGPDSPWQRELEDTFSYVETPDQMAAITEVKGDMERVVPMDRLVCGDVGYGKTEIAVRAAFKAVMDGKQVAILVPTTLLVQQHHATFADRYAGFPVTLGALSRFQTAAESKKVVDGLADGSVDVVVGTHRLLSDQVVFKDLGLVIVDEEQRFGVDHKEALKKMRLNVDVLSMSATPIPRTLEMAVTGIREMSVIATPPEERHPVLTFAGPWEEGQVRAAIRRELAREGQVFYIHNRVQTIEKTAARIRELVPEARVAVAHGQMNENALEQVMVNFWEREADVLVCTTIVEAGLDISTANTLLIERADLLGLSQLHQLRGRVGRGRERGYAYFLYPPEKPLTETAHDRLATMAAHTDLGAGMAIALRDLEIRGAGNLLGEEQSGHIADVGFDLYLRLVGEAVAEYRGEDVEPEPEMKIELPVEAHLPGEYVESERLRLEMYKRLAAVRSEAELDAVREELLDRYGPLPKPVENLLAVARFRLLCRAAGLSEVLSAGTMVRFSPVTLPESRDMRRQRLYPGSRVNRQTEQLFLPRPRTAPVAGQPLVDADLIAWATEAVTALLAPEVAASRA